MKDLLSTIAHAFVVGAVLMLAMKAVDWVVPSPDRNITITVKETI